MHFTRTGVWLWITPINPTIMCARLWITPTNPTIMCARLWFTPSNPTMMCLHIPGNVFDLTIKIIIVSTLQHYRLIWITVLEAMQDIE